MAASRWQPRDKSEGDKWFLNLTNKKNENIKLLTEQSSGFFNPRNLALELSSEAMI